MLKGLHVTFTWIVHLDGRIFLTCLTEFDYDPSGAGHTADQW
jgi:hypothetical protein